jgi:hypothetical protein
VLLHDVTLCTFGQGLAIDLIRTGKRQLGDTPHMTWMLIRWSVGQGVLLDVVLSRYGAWL